MRRIAPAMGPVLALLVAAFPSTAAHTATAKPAARTTSRSVGLDSAASSLGATFVSVSWNWFRTATGYHVQVARHKDFSDKVVTRKPRNAHARPAGGRQATVVGQLQDATYYWVRVRKVKGPHKSGWSAPVRVATKAHWPDPISNVVATPGPLPGETKISWSSGGGYTDFYKIQTALTPFGSPNSPEVGRHPMTFRASGDAHSMTLSPEQTAAAGAGLGTGHHLFYRIRAIRSGPADSQARVYGHIGSAAIAGQAPQTDGTALRIASYNIHLAARDVAGHSWASRTPLVAANVAAQQPAIVAFQELVPAMWGTNDGGIGLGAALQAVGMGRYQLTRDTAYASGSPGDVRILYDPEQVQMTSNCDPNKLSCAIKVPDSGNDHFVAYAQFRDLSSGQEFWFVDAHLTHGNDAATDSLRGQQAQTVVDAMNALNRNDLPIIFGSDLNSAQTSKGQDAPHQVLSQSGYYDTTAAATQVGLRYNSVNAYVSDEPPCNYGFGAMIDAIMTIGMPGATRFEQVLTTGAPPSDHNIIVADVRLP